MRQGMNSHKIPKRPKALFLKVLSPKCYVSCPIQRVHCKRTIFDCVLRDNLVHWQEEI